MGHFREYDSYCPDCEWSCTTRSTKCGNCGIELVESDIHPGTMLNKRKIKIEIYAMIAGIILMIGCLFALA